jgi:hypothetical protein
VVARSEVKPAVTLVGKPFDLSLHQPFGGVEPALFTSRAV